MSRTAGRILKTYVALTLLSTFASSFIWGINTLFLLDALPFIVLAVRVKAPSDVIQEERKPDAAGKQGLGNAK
ncbi:MAG: hypothetical protein M3410_04595 [Acidobacteriota bacterium]|nr:hypothetical protein [Acidobacteriota bacterium]